MRLLRPFYSLSYVVARGLRGMGQAPAIGFLAAVKGFNAPVFAGEMQQKGPTTNAR